MRYQAYLRVVNDAETIRKLHEKTNIPGAMTKPSKARREGMDEFWWQWQTETVDLDLANIDGGLKCFLQGHRPFFAGTKEHAGPEADICLELITYHKEGEEPWGLYLSRETISLLSELGASLDNDCVYDVLNFQAKELHAEE